MDFEYPEYDTTFCQAMNGAWWEWEEDLNWSFMDYV